MKQLSSFASRLKADFENLSPQLQEAARWVIDHPADVALLSLREQARRAGIAPATLTRLAQRLRLRGFEGLRQAFADAGRATPGACPGPTASAFGLRDSEGDSSAV